MSTSLVPGTSYIVQLNTINEFLGYAITYNDYSHGPQYTITWTSMAIVDGVEYGRGIGITKGAAREEAAFYTLNALLSLYPQLLGSLDKQKKNSKQKDRKGIPLIVCSAEEARRQIQNVPLFRKASHPIDDIPNGLEVSGSTERSMKPPKQRYDIVTLPTEDSNKDDIQQPIKATGVIPWKQRLKLPAILHTYRDNETQSQQDKDGEVVPIPCAPQESQENSPQVVMQEHSNVSRSLIDQGGGLQRQKQDENVVPQTVDEHDSH